jgi:hypothetical protein
MERKLNQKSKADIYTMAFYSAIRKNEILSLSGRGMELESIC